MKSNDRCPLNGSWAQECCSLYKSQLASGVLSDCRYRDGCTELKEVMVSNSNLSTLATKALLVGGIPDVLMDASLFKSAHH